MKKIILIDFNGIMVPTLSWAYKQGLTDHETKTAMLARLHFFNTKFKKLNYGEMVICTEGKSWRREVFEFYKYKRKKDKEKEKDDGNKYLNWDWAYRLMNEVEDFIKTNLQWNIINHSRCEADDVIAVLTKLKHTGEKVVIVSRDSDFHQLHYDNVKQWEPVSNKFVKGTMNPHAFLHMKCIKGDSKDGVPNVRMALDHFANGTGNQKPVTAKFIKEYVEDERYEQNRQLLDFDEIPFDIQKEVYALYQKGGNKASLDNMRTALINANYRLLAQEIKGFLA